MSAVPSTVGLGARPHLLAPLVRYSIGLQDTTSCQTVARCLVQLYYAEAAC